MNENQLRAADAYCCRVPVAPLRAKHPSGGVGVFAARPFKKANAIRPDYGTIVYHDLSSHLPAQKVYGDEILKVDVGALLIMRCNSEYSEDVLTRLVSGLGVVAQCVAFHLLFYRSVN